MFKGIVDTARAKLEALSPGKNPAGGKKIIGGKEKPVDVHVVYATPMPRGQERKRLENEAHILWNVYFTRKSKRDERAERRRESDEKEVDKKTLKQRVQDRNEARVKAKKAGKKSVAGEATSTVKKSSIKAKKAPQEKITQDKQGKWRDKRGRYAKAPKKDPINKILSKVKPGDKGKPAAKKGFFKKILSKVRTPINKRKVKAEALIFWKVYFKLKKKRTKDVKGKTKVSPAKKAIGKVKGAPGKVPVKGGGIMGMLRTAFSPVINFFTSFLGKKGVFGLFRIALVGLRGGFMLLLRGAMALATPWGLVAIATAVMVVQVVKSIKAFKDMRKAQKEAEKAELDLAAVLEKVREERAAQQANSKAAGDLRAAAMAKNQEAREASVALYQKEMKESIGGWWDSFDLAGSDKWFGMDLKKGMPFLRFKEATSEKEKKERAAIQARKDKRDVAIDKEDLELRLARNLQNAERLAVGKESLKHYSEYAPKETDLKNIERDRRAGTGIFLSGESMNKRLLKEKYSMYTPDEAAKIHRKQYESQRLAEGKPTIQVEVYGVDAVIKKDTFGGLKSKPKKKPTGGHAGRTQHRDFVSRPGMPPVSFHSNDDILGFKAGGPVSNLLKHQSATDVGLITGPDKYGKFQLNEIKTSNVYLKQLVELTAKMLQKGPTGGGGSGKGAVPAQALPADNSIQGNMEGPLYSDSRSDFHGSAYSMHTPGIPA